MNPRVWSTGALVAGMLLPAPLPRAQEPVPAPPQTRVLIVSGAVGSDEYAEQQKKWRETLVAQLTTRFQVPASSSKGPNRYFILVLSKNEPTTSNRKIPARAQYSARSCVAACRECLGSAAFRD